MKMLKVDACDTKLSKKFAICFLFMRGILQYFWKLVDSICDLVTAAGVTEGFISTMALCLISWFMQRLFTSPPSHEDASMAIMVDTLGPISSA